ncbi:hypothetical protein [Pseudomonas phage SaPL]|nr:hypothetical protein [Pseudomonas phage SaPL]
MAIVKYENEKKRTKDWSELVPGNLYIEAKDRGSVNAPVYKYIELTDGDFMVEILSEDDACFNDAGSLEGPFLEVTITEIELRIS